VAGANAALDLLADSERFDALWARSTRLREGFQEMFDRHAIETRVVGIGPLFQVWFTEHPIHNYRDAARHADQDRFRRWWEAMLERGVLFHPGPFENLFISFAHSEDDIDATLDAAASAIDFLTERA